MVYVPLVACFGSLNVLLEELSSQHLLVPHAFNDRSRVLLRVLRWYLVVVDAGLLRLTWHRGIEVGTVRLAAISCSSWATIGGRCVSGVRTSRARCVAAEVHLLRETIGDLVETRARSWARRAVCIRSRTRGARGLHLTLALALLKLTAVGVEVVEVSLRVQARLLRSLCSPNFLLTSGILVWLWECGGRGRESASLLGGEGLRVVLEAKVELQAVRVAAVLRLVVVRHDGRCAASCDCCVSRRIDC